MTKEKEQQYIDTINSLLGVIDDLNNNKDIPVTILTQPQTKDIIACGKDVVKNYNTTNHYKTIFKLKS